MKRVKKLNQLVRRRVVLTCGLLAFLIGSLTIALLTHTRAVYSANAISMAAPVFYTTGAGPHSVTEYTQPGFSTNQALAVTNNTGDSVSLFTRNGSGPYSLFSTVQLTAGAKPQRVVATGTGFGRYLAVASSGINAVTVFDLFGSAPVNLPVGVFPEGLAVADFNKDGVPDIASANWGDGTISILLAADSNSFQTSVSIPEGTHPEDIVSADFNGDGNPDLATCDSGDNKARVFIGNGNGTFKTPVPYNVGTVPYFIVSADFDGDHKPDLAVANHVTNNVSVLINNGDGTFHSAVNYPAGVDIRSLSPGDFDLDGNIDLVVASTGDNTISILRNNGNGTFQSLQSLPAGSVPFFARAGDFNSDGRPDVVVANNTTAAIGVILNNTIPSNDNFVNAQVISGVSGSVNGGNGGASKEPFEPNHAGNAGGRSVWYRYQPPSEGVATITTLNSSFDTTLAVYTGSSVDSLTEIASNDDALGRNSSVTFRAHPNTVYQIAVDGFDGAQGSIVLNWSLGALLPNDDFVTGQVLTGATGSVTGTNVGASRELGEPNHGGVSQGVSVWYNWQAPNSGKITFTTETTTFNTLLAVYTGSSVDNLQQVAENHIGCTSSVTFDAVSGTTYHIVVDGIGGLPTGIINLQWGSPPANDSLINFVSFNGNSGTILGTTRFASSEPGDPNQFGRSVWYQWQPATGGAGNISITGGATFFVYPASAISSSSVIASSSTAASFPVIAGNTYAIGVVASCVSGPFTLNWNIQPAPANNLFANATTISGETGTKSDTNIGATKEPNEPDHAGNAGGSSIWYSWQAPASGSFTFTTMGSTFDTLLAVYTGTTVNGLNEIASSDDDADMSCDTAKSRLTFAAVGGTTYHIVIDGKDGAFGNTFLRWGRSATISGNGPSTVELSGSICLTSGNSFSFQNVPTGGSYDLSASDGFGGSFTKYGGTGSISPLAGDVSGIKFMQTTPVFGASGNVVINNGTRAGVSVTCANTLVNDFPNDVRTATYSSLTGDWSCSSLWIGAQYKITPSKAGFTFTPESTTVGGGGGGGLFTGNPTMVQITVDTNPSGLMVSVDGDAPAAAPINRQWTAGSSHTITTTSPQSGTTGTRFVFHDWSDAGVISHQITVPNSDATFTANFTTQFMLTMAHGTGGTVSPASGFFNSGQSVPISATPDIGFGFTGWTGTGSGSFTGSTNSTSVTMNGPITETAAFSQNSVQVTVQTNPAGRTISIDNGPAVTAPKVVNWTPGSTHTIATTATQAGTTGTQFVFHDWSDAGAISHQVTAPNLAATFTANFTTQFMLTMAHGAGGTVSPASGFFNSGQSVQITATPTTNFLFSGWAGSGAGSFTGTTNPKDITVNGPITQTATFAPANTIQLTQTNFSGSEAAGHINVTINRNDASAAATVDYATSDTAGASKCDVNDGKASSRCDYLITLGTLQFAPGVSSKTLVIPITDDVYDEGPETFTITLTNPTGATLGSPAAATLTIDDNDVVTVPNPIDTAQFFVRQHYLDFLNREPDAGGLNFWTNEITSCGSNAACIDVKRINVSAAFFISIEFQETGYLVERLYKVAYGDGTGTSTFPAAHQLPVPIVRLNEFLSDTQKIGLGVVVNQGNWQQMLEDNKQAFAAEFVQRARFIAAFPASMTAAQFVDKLNANAGNPLSTAERDQLVNDLSTGAKTRAQVLRAVAEDPDLKAAEKNRAFVLMQFFGYLRRNPNDPQDTNYSGYDFWLTKLDQFNGDFIKAEMVKAFITSNEYRNRFGP